MHQNTVTEEITKTGQAVGFMDWAFRLSVLSLLFSGTVIYSETAYAYCPPGPNMGFCLRMEQQQENAERAERLQEERNQARRVQEQEEEQRQAANAAAAARAEQARQAERSMQQRQPLTQAAPVQRYRPGLTASSPAAPSPVPARSFGGTTTLATPSATRTFGAAAGPAVSAPRVFTGMGSSSVSAASALPARGFSGGQGSQADQPGGTFNHCVGTFYDTAHFGWLSWRNGCGVPVTVKYITWRNIGMSGSSDLQPGGTANTGWSRREINAAGGYSVAVCPIGLLAVAASGAAWSRPGSSFRCHEIGQ